MCGYIWAGNACSLDYLGLFWYGGLNSEPHTSQASTVQLSYISALFYLETSSHETAQVSLEFLIFLPQRLQ